MQRGSLLPCVPKKPREGGRLTRRSYPLYICLSSCRRASLALSVSPCQAGKSQLTYPWSCSGPQRAACLTSLWAEREGSHGWLWMLLLLLPASLWLPWRPSWLACCLQALQASFYSFANPSLRTCPRSVIGQLGCLPAT